MTDVLIRGVPEEVVEALKRRARAHNRSLQGELRELLIESSGEGATGVDGAALARRVRERIEAERGAILEDDSADIVRADREAW
ncbi:MAG: Arc family DNA-binding protein [Actinomycetota bacterium]|nr:Arc family DNA-binding protein [Actinomycetota bacterium]